MGVLACDRKGCENVMCDRSGEGYYICNDCFEELCGQGIMPIVNFMEKPKVPDSTRAVRAYYEAIFIERGY
jgi:hypothetical protein